MACRTESVCGMFLGVMLAVMLAMSPLSAAAANRQSQSHAQCHLSLPQIYKDASPAVVTIISQTVRPYQFANRVERSVGSGIIFERRGFVLTNDHVVAGANAVQITLDNGNAYPAQVVGADALFDLAVLYVKAPEDGHLPTVPLGDSSTLNVGDDVVAIGNPLGLDQTLTHGVVSGLNRMLPDSPLTLSTQMIQTDAAINPGNSGGPLLNRCGQVVGINAEILSGGQNLGFAIPIDLAKAVLPSLLEKGHVERPWVGFHGELIDHDMGEILGMAHAPGLLVEAVDQNSPAAKAGITGGVHSLAIDGAEYLIGGDFVTQMNDIRLDSDKALRRITQELKVGTTLKVTYYRGGEAHNVSYKLEERPPSLDARIAALAQNREERTAPSGSH